MNIEQSFARTRHAHDAGDRTGAQTAQPATGKQFRLPFALTLDEVWTILSDVATAVGFAGAFFWAWAGPVAAALAAALAGTIAVAIAASQMRQPWNPDSCRPRPFRSARAREGKYPSHPRHRK